MELKPHSGDLLEPRTLLKLGKGENGIQVII